MLKKEKHHRFCQDFSVGQSARCIFTNAPIPPNALAACQAAASEDAWVPPVGNVLLGCTGLTKHAQNVGFQWWLLGFWGFVDFLLPWSVCTILWMKVMEPKRPWLNVPKWVLTWCCPLCRTWGFWMQYQFHGLMSYSFYSNSQQSSYWTWSR